MHVDFEEVKKVPIPEVCARLGIRLRYQGEYGRAKCPLPTHREDDKQNMAFQVHIPTNRWQCKSQSCGVKNGVGDKWGDVINFVQVKEGLRGQKEAAERLANWYGLNGNVQRQAAPASASQRKPAPDITANKNGSQSESRKPEGQEKGYMQRLGNWFDELVVQSEHEDDKVFWARVKKGVLDQVHASYLNGQKKAKGLPVEQSF